MAQREPKSVTRTVIKVTGRTGDKKGSLELTSGNVSYTRSNADSPVLTLTYQQLLSLFEEHVAYRDLRPDKVRLPKPHPDGDFAFHAIELDEAGDPMLLLAHGHSSINRLDERRLAHGRYQFSYDMANGRKPKRQQWWAQVSVQAALWILERYVHRLASVARKSQSFTNETIVVSKMDLRKILLSFLKRLDGKSGAV
ncbi:hypothetical protein R77592_04303 [Ralstonia mannitolilytica]|uniref:hypothetical protein n=1 Tax=Ralstonia mannitolilytica TaxID=105219 RepID=UPI0028F56B0A|nr:hypothetical protein [Ralstonia mannitolilytica]CAJ0737371.1 hypothetical protein R77592_04303 [Ralstonia mannitolilytica]